MPRHYSFETYSLKKELVKNYESRGLSISQMIKLLDQQHLFSAEPLWAENLPGMVPGGRSLTF